MMRISNGVTILIMSIHELSRAITKEIEKVNDRIDMKIVRGRSYQKEAQHHRVLVARLEQLEHSRRRDLYLARHHRVLTFAR